MTVRSWRRPRALCWHSPLAKSASVGVGSPPVHHHRRYSMRPLRRPRRGPKPDRRRALELLASSPDGATEAIMIAHGITVEMMVELVRSGLASATPERVVAGKRAMQITRVRITDAGRRALAGT